MNNNHVTIAVIVSLIFAGSIFGYYFIDQGHKTEIRLQRQKCLDALEQKFLDHVRGKNLSIEGTKVVQDHYQKQKDECFKLYQ